MIRRILPAILALSLVQVTALRGQSYLDNETGYSNQDPETETRRSDHFRINFGHYNRDTGTPVTEQLIQGNLQMFEQFWNRWVNEMGLHDINESALPQYKDGKKYRANFNVLMTWDDGGGGGAFSSMDAKGFFYCMTNSSSMRFDPPSGTTPHEFGHVWQGTGAGFNGTDSTGSWWENGADWMMLQFLNTYPQADAYLYNGMYYPAHGRDYYHSWPIYETAREDPRYGAAWVNLLWTDATPTQQTSEFILDRMIRIDPSGSPDKAGAMKDLWGDMARKLVTWDFERQRWLAQANKPDDGSNWEFYQRCRTPLIKMPGNPGWFRPSRDHLPMEFGFNIIPLAASAGTTVGCNFQPQGEPLRQSDWRACLVAVNTAGEASYSTLWNKGNNSINLSADQTKLYLVVIATPKPMKIADPAWQAYLTDAGAQFPYAVSFTNAAPKNIFYPAQSRTGMVQHANGGGWKSTSATVDASAYIGPNAQVLDSAQVRGNARIEDYAVVRGNAQVRDNAVVSGRAVVEANAQVYGNAKVRDFARVFGYAEVFENARVIEHANCGDGDAAVHSKVYGNASVKGTTYLYNTSTLNGGLIMDGDSANGNGTSPASTGVHFGWGWGSDTARFASLPDNGYLFAQHTFESDSAVFAKDQFGINHGFLMGGCRAEVDPATPKRGGRVLLLNGSDQYVELHNAVNDFKDSTYSLWFKRTGTAPGQQLWSMGDGAAKAFTLTANDANGALRLTLTNGTTTQSITGPAVAVNTWAHVAVVFSGATCTLYVNGNAAGSIAALSLWPDSLNAPMMENANYLGRDNTGNFFAGALDDFRVCMRPLSAAEVLALASAAAPATITATADTTAPTPNAATWLVAPTAVTDDTVTMSATPGTDASGWVEYYFTCTGGGHDSGWVSFNKYTDVGLAPGSAPTYTVKMRDRSGNTTAASAAAAATAMPSSAGTASFAYGPVGTANGQITMTAAKVPNASGKIEYKFDRTSPTASSSGWQSSPSFTQTGLTTGSSYSYTVTIRDGRGNTSAPSAAVTAIARDDAGPQLPFAFAHWQMQPYATIDNKVSMTAAEATDPSGVEYYFECTSGNGPNSGWQASATFLTTALPDGTYTYRYKVRDKSARFNESAWSVAYPARITPTTGYHDVAFSQLTTLADDSLVTFNGVILQANPKHYVVRDVASGATIKVKTSAYAEATDPAKVLKLCQIKGHLWTYSGERMVTYATVAPVMDPPGFALSGRVSDSASGLGLANATVYVSPVAGAATNAVLSTTTDASGAYSLAVPNGTWYVAAAAADHFASAERTVSISGFPVGNTDFSLVPAVTITATSSGSGSITPAGAVLVNSGASQTFTITPAAGQSIASVLVDGVEMGSINSFTFGGVTANRAIAVTFAPNTLHTPQSASLIESALVSSLPASGVPATWSSYLPAGRTYTAMRNPTVAQLGNTQWLLNSYADSDGFLCSDRGASSIPVNGVTIVTAIKPVRNSTATSWNSIVDIFYDRLVLGIYNTTGELMVRRNGSHINTGVVIPDNQSSVLSLVVQPDGTFKLYVNGALAYTNTTTSAMTSLVPGVAGAYATKINVGRNDPDGWTTYNGYLGDFFIYGVALTDAERASLEGDIAVRAGTGVASTITASAGTGGSISPAGVTSVPYGGSATYVVTANPGYVLTDLVVDGVSKGPLASYTFSDVTSNRTISATFASVPAYTITATAGANGTISPAGAVLVNAGGSRSFTITPATGYQVADVLIDGVSVGAVTSYTFNNVQGARTIAASFTPRMLTVTASAGAGGTISPSGASTLPFGSNQTYTITPSSNRAISSVYVDGVDVGPVGSYTFSSLDANHTIQAVFVAGTRQIPAANQLHFSVDTKDLPASGSITAWPWLWPTGQTLTSLATPTVQTVNTAKWESNLYADGDGFRVGQYSTPIVVTGATVVCAVKPTRNTTAPALWHSVVDVMYGELVLGLANNTGLPTVRLKKNTYTGTTAVPNGQATVLSLVVQPGGAYNLYANGVLIMSGTGAAMSEWKPGNTTGNPSTGTDTFINIGRNNSTATTAFNGNIGDVFLYKTALDNAQRTRLEADVMSKFGMSPGNGATYTITATAGPGGTVGPAGAVQVVSGADKTFTITPNSGYVISDVQIDGVSVGVAGSFTFTSVSANRSISATFARVSANIGLTRAAGTSASSTYGDALAFDITVGGPTVPTGTVTLRNGGATGTVLGSAALVNGACSIALAANALPAGTHANLVAVYSGDSSYPALTSSPLDAQTVAPKPLTVSGGSVASRPYDGTTDAAISGPFTLGGVVAGDAISLVIPATGVFADKNVGTGKQVTATFSLSGARASSYTLTPPVLTADITPRVVTLAGNKVYDGTTAASAAAGTLTIGNNVDGADLTLSGSATLANRHVGSQNVTPAPFTPARVQSATGFSTAATSTSFAVTLSAAPTAGNTLIAVISTRGTAANQVSGITSAGATWTRATQSVNANGSTTEIWYAPVGAGAATGVTISISGRCAGVVMEYSGLLTAGSLDQVNAASSSGNSTAPLTGTTAATTQAGELWIGAIGYRSSTPTLSAIQNSFTSVASAQSNSTTAGNNAKVYARPRARRPCPLGPAFSMAPTSSSPSTAPMPPPPRSPTKPSGPTFRLARGAPPASAPRRSSATMASSSGSKSSCRKAPSANASSASRSPSRKPGQNPAKERQGPPARRTVLL